jgi:four helix bundle protein
MGEFDHCRLDVYRKALGAYRAAQRLAPRIRRADFPLADQLIRAVMSIVLNIAEGSGERSRKEKARFYRMARRSAAEAAAALDLAAIVDPMLAPELAALQKELGEIAAMLTTMIKRLETPSPSPSPSPSPKH